METYGIVLAGGRSSRLRRSAPMPTPDKPLLRGPSGTLLDHAISALEVAGGVPAERTVVVGPDDLPVPAGVRITREDPPYSGPAAAIRAGLRALGGAAEPSRAWTFVIAADMPAVSEALTSLLRARDDRLASSPGNTSSPGERPGVGAAREPEAAASDGPRAFLGLEGEQPQPLLSLLRLDAALAAFDAASANASVRSRLRTLDPVPVRVAPEAAVDVDTWEDAQTLGFAVAPTAQGDESR